MTVGILTIKILIPDAFSLKEKRRVLRSLKERLKNAFNISIAEIDQHDKWQTAGIAIANISKDKRHAESQLYKITDFIDDFNKVQLLDSKIELI